MMNDIPELMTVRDFCHRYSISRSSLYREIVAGRLAHRKFGTASRIARADAEAWAARLPVISGEAA